MLPVFRQKTNLFGDQLYKQQTSKARQGQSESKEAGCGFGGGGGSKRVPDTDN